MWELPMNKQSRIFTSRYTDKSMVQGTGIFIIKSKKAALRKRRAKINAKQIICQAKEKGVTYERRKVDRHRA